MSHRPLVLALSTACLAALVAAPAADAMIQVDR
jgi:hypothetical protein